MFVHFQAANKKWRPYPLRKASQTESMINVGASFNLPRIKLLAFSPLVILKIRQLVKGPAHSLLFKQWQTLYGKKKRCCLQDRWHIPRSSETGTFFDTKHNLHLSDKFTAVTHL